MDGILNQKETVLFLGCHLDDVEFGCGGLMTKLAEAGYQVQAAVLSAANRNAAGEVQLERDREEACAAMEKLGLGREQLVIGSCFGQVFDQTPQQLREELLSLRARFQPGAVFYPAVRDVHQDHGALAENAFRIFRNVSCFGYEVIRSTFDFSPSVYVELSPRQLERKVEAVLCYRSQKSQSAGYYFDEELVRACARFRGGQCDMPFAEGYECYRLMWRSGEER